MVSVKLPRGVLADVATVRVELAPAATEGGLNEAVAPVGRPLALKLTETLKPLRLVVETVYATVAPSPTDGLEGASETIKSCETSRPYTFRTFENEAMYTLPLTTVG